ELKLALERFKLGHSSTLQLLSSRMGRIVRYNRRKAYIYIGSMVILTLCWVGGTFTPLLWERETVNDEAEIRKLADLNMAAQQRLSEANNDTDLKSVQSSIQSAIDLEQKLPNRTDYNLARAWTLQTLGDLYLRQGAYSEAESKLEAAYKLFVDNHGAKAT